MAGIEFASFTNSTYNYNMTDTQGYIYEKGIAFNSIAKQCVALVLGLDNQLPHHVDAAPPGQGPWAYWTNGSEQVDFNGAKTVAGFNPVFEHAIGTPIATFVNGIYPQGPGTEEHAAIFLGYGTEAGQAGFFVLDRYFQQPVNPASEPAEVRFVGFANPYAHEYYNIVAHPA